ncbi:uncharacterized protein PHACADRAFT_103387 [Phanerochaete carnosa HHB-10118-sp]|uniref:F-box domain-containing protein n=1 Tax=Phanerochaete carnosa (strain HHB-10118-sp) TaxID=650164 RepID=K5VJ43_PHACS|nr:uncharacterized protein PHACADRAFT_103387 [Phanerochaete carnosa HHB-10118-sp]EKM51313.1 hypothetical protein PHACADRAFT_103387 [Phanerochaete carnosa HHB-10118-sp]
MQHLIAQNCIEDVLLEILHDLPPHDLATTARLCRTWLYASRVLLYRHIHFNTSVPSAAQLEALLRSSPYLRTLVHSLVLFHQFPAKDVLLEWIALLPENGLVSVKFERMPLEASSMSLLQFPAIRTSNEIIIGHPYFLLENPERLSDILSYPSLRRLSLFIPKSLPIRPSIALRLSRLSLAILTEHCPRLLEEMLRAITSPLIHLNLLLPCLESDTASWLGTILARHLPTLRYFTVKALDQDEIAPLLDDMITSLTSVEVLACGVGTYTSKLFNGLPACLRSLTLEGRNHDPFPVPELSDAVARLRSRSTAFESMTIGRQPSYASHRHFDTLSRTCASLGVSFTIAKPRLGEHFL